MSLAIAKSACVSTSASWTRPCQSSGFVNDGRAEPAAHRVCPCIGTRFRVEADRLECRRDTSRGGHGSWTRGTNRGFEVLACRGLAMAQEAIAAASSHHESFRVQGASVMPVESITNFLAIDDRIGTAGQPSETELREVAADGYTAVVNLGLLDPRYCLADEAGLVRSLGLRYHHIPVEFDAPTAEHFRRFLAAMDESAGGRVLVHCAMNFRVSSFMAVYGEMKLGWTREQADAHARRLWPLNEVWTAFLENCRAEIIDGAR